jgi:hypothetical protein
VGGRYETRTGTGTGPYNTGTGPQTGSATPYPPLTGPTTVGPTGIGPVPAAPPKRRRLRTFVLALALAVIVAGGTAVALQKWNHGAQSDAGGTLGSPSPTPSATPTGGSDGTVPANWRKVDDPYGFSVYLPRGWKRTEVTGTGDVDPDLRQVDYSPDDGKHFVRIAIDTSPDFADATQHQQDLEQQLQKLVGYHRVQLQKNLYRDRNGSVWEYTWTALAKDTKFPGPRRAIEETYISREGTEYAIYVSSPAADWAQSAKRFKAILQGWQEKTAQ